MTEADSCWGKLTCGKKFPKKLPPVVALKGKKFIIGRGKDCHLQLGVKMISSQHCYLEKDDNDKVWLYDTSSNGTFLNKTVKLIPGEGHQLQDGDKIYLVSYKKQPDLDVCYAFRLNFDESFDGGSNETGVLLSEENDGEVPAVKKQKLSSPSEENEVSVCETDQNTINEVAEVTSKCTELENKSKEADDGLQSKNKIEEALQCSLCMEILYDPVSLIPCLHSYCATCYYKWMQVVKNCPQCRASVDSIARNHVIKNLVEAYLLQHPEKHRTQSDIEKLHEYDTKVENMLSSKTSSGGDRFQDRSEYFSSDLDDDDDDDFDPFYSDRFAAELPFLTALSAPGIRRFQLCRQCPGEAFNIKPAEPRVISLTGANASEQKTSLPDSDEPVSKKCKVEEEAETKNNLLDQKDIENVNVVDGKQPDSQAFPVNLYRCSPTQTHIRCSCCFENMPDRRNERISNASIPPQSCKLCNRMFCNMYWICRKTDCYGCLAKFGELNLGEKCLTSIIMKNAVESRILMDYLESQGMTWRDFFKECIRCLDSGQYNCPVNINSETVICYSCGLKNFRILAYSYRCDIPRNLLPGAASRPDCYWGKNCRTQGHKPSHAMKYNHVCEQTR